MPPDIRALTPIDSKILKSSLLPSQQNNEQTEHTPPIITAT